MLLGFYSKKITLERLHLFPLYSDIPLNGVSVSKLHISYNPKNSVKELYLNRRAANTIKSLKIRTIGELLLTSSSQILRQWNCGVTTLKLIQDEVEFSLTNSIETELPKWDSFEDMLDLEMPLNERLLAILKTRIGVDRESYCTLEECGAIFGITREAARQSMIKVRSAVNHPSTVRQLSSFWIPIDKILRNQWVVTSKSLARRLKSALDWQTMPEAHAVGMFVELRDSHYLARSQLISSPKFDCFKCAKAKNIIIKIVNNRNEVPIQTLKQQHKDVLHEYCPKHRKFNKTVVEDLFDVHLSNFIREKNGYIKRNQKIMRDPS
ncbi:MAG: DNA-directed RNA polymerase subunit alpha C-terminal domain-containing protein [Candidatus Cloacimonas sp.]|nr:hypothetical protein [Candidatus Cloacimonadota bacterium]